MSKAASVLNRGDRIATVRCSPRFMIVSSDWTTRQVDQVPHADPVGDFPRFRAAGREDAAHQTIAAELFHPVLPALGAQTQPLEDPGQLLTRSRLFPGERVGPNIRPECCASTARHTVIPPRHRHINQFGSGDRDLGNLLGVRLYCTSCQ
jgi:hypothetical protein